MVRRYDACGAACDMNGETFVNIHPFPDSRHVVHRFPVTEPERRQAPSLQQSSGERLVLSDARSSPPGFPNVSGWH